ncbi:hypothetical protein GQX74_014040 [Glossina fuscipes]|nr:hypothetical protein GQX74_014040 [Glossina fuscipes]
MHAHRKKTHPIEWAEHRRKKYVSNFLNNCGATSGTTELSTQKIVIGKSQMPILVLFGPEPQQLRCPRCKCEITTFLRGRSTYVTHLVAVILTIVWYAQQNLNRTSTRESCSSATSKTSKNDNTEQRRLPGKYLGVFIAGVVCRAYFVHRCAERESPIFYMAILPIVALAHRPLHGDNPATDPDLILPIVAPEHHNY